MEDWVEWMRDIHIPDVMATGLFIEYRFNRLLGMDDSEGTTFTVQYYLLDVDQLQLYQQKYAGKLQQEHGERFGDKFVAFRTVMHIISSSKVNPTKD